MEKNVGNEVEDKMFLMDFPPIEISKYELLQKLANGHLSSIYQIRDKETNEIQTAKVFSYNESNKKKDQIPILFSHFVTLHSQLSHPLIEKFIGYSPVDFKNKNNPVVITELFRNGSLYEIVELEKKGSQIENWNSTMKLVSIYSIAAAMSYLHSKDIIHRNLRLKDVFLDNSLFPKIGGLTFAKFLTDEKDDQTIGEAPYNAPEVWTDNEYSKASDVYSFSIIVYQLITLLTPYENVNYYNIINKVAVKKERPIFKNPVPDAYKKLIESCWNQDPNKRPSFKQIVEELKTNQEFITKDVDEKFYRLYIDIIEKEINGIDTKSLRNQLFSENQQDLFYDKLQKLIEEERRIDEKEMNDLLKSLNLKNIDLDNFEKIDDVGEGGYGLVFKIKEKATGKIFVAKQIKSKMSEKLNFLKELKIFSDVNHPSITKIIGYSLFDFNQNSNLIIILEYVMNGSLERILSQERNDVKPEFETNTFELINIYGIASALLYLHSRNILHLDVKPSNVLVDYYLFPKLCDFGLSTKVKNDQQFVRNNKGTVNFTAPEIFANSTSSKKSDVYSFGMLLYELKSKSIPFQDKPSFYIISCVTIKQKRPQIDESVPGVYKKLIKSCWDQDPDKRPSFEQIVEELKTNREFITKDIDEKLYRLYIEIIDKEIKGIDTQIMKNNNFKSYNLDSIYHEYYKNRNYSDTSDYFSTTNEIKNIDEIEETKKMHEDLITNVYKYRNKKTNIAYSVTISKYEIDFYNQELISKISKEAKILSQLKHPAIQQFYGFSLIDKKKQRKPMIINEYFKYRTLFDILQNERKGKHEIKWTDTNKLNNIYGIASAMSYLHSHHICNPKLNPKNILLDKNFHPKLSEIGFYSQPANSESALKIASNIFDCSFLYLSPEQLEMNDIINDEKSDVYSFALVMYHILTNIIPFNDFENHQVQLAAKVINENYRPSFDQPIPDIYKKLIERCWSKEPSDRPLFSEIVNELETNPEFITPEIIKNEYVEYQQLIKQQQKQYKCE